MKSFQPMENNLKQPKKSIFKRWPLFAFLASRDKWFWVIIIFVIGIGVFGYIFIKNINGKNSGSENQGIKIFENGFHWPSKTAKYITSLPVDLTQIQSISKYRSCAGHIRDGYNFGQELELDRSMKHYLFPTPEFQNTNDKVKLFAPFDGNVIRLDLEKDKGFYGRNNAGNGIHLSTPVDPNIDFVIGHLYFAKEYKVGDKVKAGELIGYAAVGCSADLPGCDFDLDLSTPNGTSAYQGREVLGSIFDHMTDPVLAEFAKYGITPDNTKFTKEYRDAKLCGFGSEDNDQQKTKEEAEKDFDGHHNDNFIQLTH